MIALLRCCYIHQVGLWSLLYYVTVLLAVGTAIRLGHVSDWEDLTLVLEQNFRLGIHVPVKRDLLHLLLSFSGS